MLREYCEAVRNYFSKITVLNTKSDRVYSLSSRAELNLESISEAIHSSTYELSRKFKKETGQTLTDYINTLRIIGGTLYDGES